MKAIGPNFINELRAAGIALDGVAWGTDGQISFAPFVTQQTRDAVATVYAAHDPATPSAPLQRIATDEAERATCALDATILSLINMDRAGWRGWAGTNFPTLTQPERTRIGDLFWVVAIGVRQRLRV